MATTVDTLLVRIEADLSDLRRDLKKATAASDNASSKIRNSFNRIGKAAKLALGGVVVAAVSRATMSMINLASGAQEMQGKSSVVFGQFRDEVVADLEKFGDAVGRSTFALEGMAASLQDTFVPMGFARGEAAKLSVQMTKLAVDVGSFNDLSEVETMKAFQSALVGNHETVRRFGVIINQAGLNQELLNMGIRGGVKAATESQKVMARMNLILAGTVDAQGDALKTSASFANELRALKANLSEFATEIGTVLLPIATALVRAMNFATQAVRAFFDALEPDGPVAATKMEDAQSDLKKVRAEIQIAMDELQRLNDLAAGGNGDAAFALEGAEQKAAVLIVQYQKAIATVQRFARAAEEAANAVELIVDADMQGEDYLETIDKQTEALVMARMEASGYSSELVKLAQSAGLLEFVKTDGTVTSIVGDNAMAQIEILQLLIEQMDAVNKQLEVKKKIEADAKKITDAYNKSAEKGAQFARENADSHHDLKQALEDVNNAYKEELISLELRDAALENINRQMSDLKPLLDTFNSAISAAATNISESFADALLSGKSAMSGLKDAFKGFVKVMIAKAIELFVVNQIMNAVFGGFGGYTKLPQAQLFGNKASGGAVQQGQPYMVGERGPEMFIPHSGGTIRNAADSKGGGGGTTVINQSISVETGVSQTVRAEMTSILPQFKQETMSAIVDAKRRGGSFGQAMG